MNAHAEAMMKRLVVVVVRISRNKLNSSFCLIRSRKCLLSKTMLFV